MAAGARLATSLHRGIAGATLIRAAPAGVAIGVLVALLLLAHVAVRTANTRLDDLGAYRRLWSDQALATTALVKARTAETAPRARNPRSTETCHRLIVERVNALRIRPWQFWRTIRPDPFVREGIYQVPAPYDDPGRAFLLGAAFQVLGGVAPYLVFWIAPILGAPVLGWAVAEIWGRGHECAAVLFGGLLVLSPFVVEVLALSRSPVGFYLVAWLALVALAAFAMLGSPPGPRSLLIRCGVAGIVFAVCAYCRIGSLFLTPGVALAVAVAARRTPSRRRTLLVAFCGLLFLGPFFAVRSQPSHNRWQPLWEGLGDFDRTHAFTWSDPLAEEWAVRHGAHLWTDEGEAAFRADMLATIRREPVWFVGILAQRLGATITQHKLWPRIATDGLWMRRSTSMNEGFMDKYYTYTETVDFLGWGSHLVKVPVTILILPTVALLALRRGSESRVLAAAAAAVFVPVLVSTASGQETQTFALVYFLGLAFAVENAARRLWRQRVSRGGHLRSAMGCGWFADQTDRR
jgi:hypothetical protein